MLRRIFCAPSRFAMGFLAAVTCILSGCANRGERTISLTTELVALTNQLIFAEAPKGRAGMVSSYDRSGGNADWDTLSNVDARGHVVILDLKGPGVVRRWWNAGMRGMEFFFYFDDEVEPRIRVNGGRAQDGESDLFKGLLCAGNSGLYTCGWYSYLPMPFKKRLRIEAVCPPNQKLNFYQFNYELFDKGVNVESFPRVLSAEDRQSYEAVVEHWGNMETVVRRDADACSEHVKSILSPGESWTWLDRSGAGILQAFTVHFRPEGSGDSVVWARFLRGLMIRMWWDGAEAPSVDVPLGDFFMNPMRGRRYTSMPLAYDGTRYICRFPMPFRENAHCEIRNDTDLPVEVTVTYRLDARFELAPGLRLFHANWLQDTGKGVPYNVAALRGEGHLVGCMLKVIAHERSWNILEGDERILVDGDSAGLLHGTGLEDFFNGAYYYGRLCDRPLHGLIEKAAMRTVQYRFLQSDRVGFRDSLRFTFEFGHGSLSRGYMSSVAYWYQREPRPCNSTRAPESQRRPQPDQDEPFVAMCGLSEFERVGLLREAEEWCRQLARTYAGSPVGPLYGLRELAYRELVNGYASVSNSYAFIMGSASGTAAAEQARDLMWLHESPSNQLLLVQSSGQHRVYLDRELVSEGDSLLRPIVTRLRLTPGEHELAVELTPVRPQPGLLVFLRTPTGDISLTDRVVPDKGAASGWVYSRSRPIGWPAVEDTDAWPGNMPTTVWPTMQSWLFEPNGYAGMQSTWYICDLWNGWSRGRQAGYLHRTFLVPEQ